MGKYVKYGACTSLCLITVSSFVAGGHWLWFPFLFTFAVAIVGDAALPKDTDFQDYKHTWLLNAFLYSNLPLLFLANLMLLWQFAPGDFLGIGAWMEMRWNIPVLTWKAETTGFDLVGGFTGLGLIFGIAGTNVAHELVHRTWSPLAQELGRGLLAFTWDSEFAIEHVYGHHRKAATWEDPASARRGESFFRFFARSLIGGNRSAWLIERQFLRKKQQSMLSWNNRLLRGWLFSGILAALAFWAAGWMGLVFHAVLALYGKSYLELVNYIEHYGLVRVPNTPVHFRHSWNSNAAVSSWFLYNLTRHSHHHQTGHIPFWKLQPKTDAPSLPFGYMAMIIIALVPPIYRKVMAPQLAEWDTFYASSEEKFLLNQMLPQS